MQVLSLLVREEWGVAQRVLSLLTRKRISIETVLVGRCEKPHCLRMVLASSDARLRASLEHLRRLHDVLDASYFEEHSDGVALLRPGKDALPPTGKAGELVNAVPATADTAYVKAYGAL